MPSHKSSPPPNESSISKKDQIENMSKFSDKPFEDKKMKAKSEYIKDIPENTNVKDSNSNLLQKKPKSEKLLKNQNFQDQIVQN